MNIVIHLQGAGESGSDIYEAAKTAAVAAGLTVRIGNFTERDAALNVVSSTGKIIQIADDAIAAAAAAKSSVTSTQKPADPYGDVNMPNAAPASEAADTTSASEETSDSGTVADAGAVAASSFIGGLLRKLKSWLGLNCVPAPAAA